MITDYHILKYFDYTTVEREKTYEQQILNIVSNTHNRLRYGWLQCVLVILNHSQLSQCVNAFRRLYELVRIHINTDQ